ncbi:MAG: DUF882 domain-containing protein [Rhizobiales bacterium]|nr:DUF882 domain-containing protein [Hyphomicrobiales bacterium]
MRDPTLRLASLEPASAGASAGGRRSAGAVGAAIQRQTGAVSTSCFPASLVNVLDRMRVHFGAPVIVTSGYRSPSANRRAGGARDSYHMRCQAADVQITGVAPSAIMRFARAQAEVGGVGAYRHTRSVHIDVGGRKFSWFGRGGHSHSRVRLAMR